MHNIKRTYSIYSLSLSHTHTHTYRILNHKQILLHYQQHNIFSPEKDGSEELDTEGTREETMERNN
jgi:hypothetical protein